MSTQHSDCREDIFESAKFHTQDMVERRDSEDGFDCLDVEIWRRDNFPDLIKVEFVLALGGPTVSVMVDERGLVTYYHSWGCRPNGDDLHEIRLHGELAEEWRQLAESFLES